MGAFVETDESRAERIELHGVIGGAAPADVFDAFVRTDRITRWWPDEAEIDAVVGGRYELRWPAMEWTLRGTFTEVDPGRALAFTWSWDHEPDTPERTVRITLTPTHAGAEVTLSHGTYTATDAGERTGHLDGWRFFLRRLEALFE